MLKALRVTSFIAVILACCGVGTMIFIGLKKDPQASAFLNSPGIVEQFQEESGKQGKEDKKDKESILVAQARAFALRIDPPPPPPPPKPKVKPVAQPKVAKPEPTKPKLPTPKVAVSLKSDLLATVVYQSTPEKSLALLKTSGNTQEWFRQGDTVGHLEIKEVRDGSVIFTQGGKNPQEKFVPEKPKVKTLLKNDQKPSTVSSSDSERVAAPAAVSARKQKILKSVASPARVAEKKATDSGADRPVRPLDRTSQPRPDVTQRIQRVRSAPKVASPQEQKHSLDETMSGIEAIMNRQDESISSEQREKENEMWTRLIEELNKEKAQVDRPQEDTEKKSEEADKPAAPKPKKP